MPHNRFSLILQRSRTAILIGRHFHYRQFKPISTNSLLQQNHKPLNSQTLNLSLAQKLKWRFAEGEKSYEHFRQTYPSGDEILRFLLKNGAYVFLASGLAALYKTRDELAKQLDHLDLATNQLARESSHSVEKLEPVRVQPLLYLTTILNSNEGKIYHQAKADLVSCIERWQSYEKQLNQLKGHGWFKYLSTLGLMERFRQLETLTSQQKTYLGMVANYNEVVWLHKNRQYELALSKNKQLIDLLEEERKKVTTIFPVTILAAIYNTQAKLEACMAKMKANPERAKEYRKLSLQSYEKAIDLLKKSEEEPLALATLLSSKAYLLDDMIEDMKEPEEKTVKLQEAHYLREEANRLKPNDEHILCGMGLDLYLLELQKLREERDLLQLDLAYGYFTRALQINNSVPNVYVSRGKLLVELGDHAAAMADFDRALELDKYHSEAHIQKAQLLMRKADCLAAEQHFKQGLLPIIDQNHQVEKRLSELEALQKTIKSACQPITYGNLFRPAINRSGNKSSQNLSLRCQRK